MTNFILPFLMESRLACSCAVYCSKMRGLNGSRMLVARVLAENNVTRMSEEEDGLYRTEGRLGVASTMRS